MLINIRKSQVLFETKKKKKNTTNTVRELTTSAYSVYVLHHFSSTCASELPNTLQFTTRSYNEIISF